MKELFQLMISRMKKKSAWQLQYFLLSGKKRQKER